LTAIVCARVCRYVPYCCLINRDPNCGHCAIDIMAKLRPWSHGVAQVTTHSQDASQGTGVVNVRIWRCIDYLHLHLRRDLAPAHKDMGLPGSTPSCMNCVHYLCNQKQVPVARGRTIQLRETGNGQCLNVIHRIVHNRDAYCMQCWNMILQTCRFWGMKL
jgi:hypothetical protein